MGGFVYTVDVEVEFTDEELSTLSFLALNHYDGRCQSAAQVGGFLYGMQNAQRFDRERGTARPVHLLDFREIDTLCKVLESKGMFHAEDALFRVASDLAYRLEVLLEALSEERARVNRE